MFLNVFLALEKLLLKAFIILAESQLPYWSSI
jgi:hypothetical protein